MNLSLKIYEPSGEERIIALKGVNGEVKMGRNENCQIPLKDPTLSSEPVSLLFQFASTEKIKPFFWMKIPPTSTPANVGGFQVREAEIPIGMSVKIGETRFQIESTHLTHSLPPFPTGVRPWQSCTDSGKELLWNVKKAASTPLSTYLAGETGTGKEVLAHLIHAWSPRKPGPFVPIHCGALPLSLAESELFGHVKGAFTGAANHRTGALMQAHGGTLFLDEVGDLPLDIQVKLLRFLENGEIRPVGSDRSSHADVRIVCATHHPLLKLVEEGKFRRDLYFRLASITITIPTLRSRPDDIELLAKKFASELNRTLSPRSILRLQAHSWPGNVRELRHAVERACGIASPFSSLLDEEAFQFLLTSENLIQTPELETGTPVLKLSEMERVLLLKALRLSHGNRAKAAKILGVARSTLFEMLKRHKIAGPRTPYQFAVSQPTTFPDSK